MKLYNHFDDVNTRKLFNIGIFPISIIHTICEGLELTQNSVLQCYIK